MVQDYEGAWQKHTHMHIYTSVARLIQIDYHTTYMQNFQGATVSHFDQFLLESKSFIVRNLLPIMLKPHDRQNSIVHTHVVLVPAYMIN